MSEQAMNIGELMELGKEGFFDLMLERLQRQPEDPALSVEDRERFRARYEKAKAELAARRGQSEPVEQEGAAQ